jgi:hypothetical protein
MVEIIEKSGPDKVPSCIIDKKLVSAIGQLLESDKSLQSRLSYYLDTKRREIKSKKVSDFTQADWTSKLNRLTIETDGNSPRVKIEVNFRQPRNSELLVSGEDPIWVSGMKTRIEEIFQECKTSYHRVNNPGIYKVPLTFLLTLVFLIIPAFLLLNPLGTILTMPVILIITLIASPVAIVFYALMDWLLPYFEYDKMKQMQLRKWIMAAITGSGIVTFVVTYLITKLLGL